MHYHSLSLVVNHFWSNIIIINYRIFAHISTFTAFLLALSGYGTKKIRILYQFDQ
jgi:hypothetical protein